MQYVGIDWAYRRAAWCALGEGGVIVGEGVVSADEDGLARLVLAHGGEVRACVEMMSGAVWVRDRLAAAGWRVQVAHAGRVRDVAPLACKTDKVDARVLAELCRRDLVPALWIPSLEDRALRERLRRRMHLVRLRASAMNRIFGLLTQWGLRLSLERLRAPDAMELLAARGVEETWRRSIAEALAVIDLLDERIAPLRAELAPFAAADRRVLLLRTIPGIGELLGLTIAAEIGDVARFGSPRKLIRLRRHGAAHQSVRRALTHRRALEGRLAHAALGRRRGRPPVLATDQPLAPALHPARRPPRQEPRQVRRRTQGPDRHLARPLTQRTLQTQPPPRHHTCPGKLPLLSGRLTAPHGIEKPRQLPRTICAPSAEREMSHPSNTNHTRPPPRARQPAPTQRESGTRRQRDTAHWAAEEQPEYQR
jgi:transposase